MFLRHASEADAEQAVELTIGPGWTQLQAVVEEVVARTRNMCIDFVQLWCLTCASPFISLWHKFFNDSMQTRAAKLYMTLTCSPNSDTSLQQIFLPFVSSKLGVVNYEISVAGGASHAQERDEFDALWTAWDRSTAQIAAFDLYSMDLCPHFLEKLLHEPEHGSRHYTLEGGYISEGLEIVENYMQVSSFKTIENV